MDDGTYLNLSEEVGVFCLENVIPECNVGDLFVFDDPIPNANFDCNKYRHVEDIDAVNNLLKLETANETLSETELIGKCSDKSKHVKVIEATKCWRQKEVVIKTLESQFTVVMWSLDDDDEHKENLTSETEIKMKADNNNANKLRTSYKNNRQTSLQLPCTFGTCKKLFTHLSALRKHLRTHKERTFICPVCNKAFVERSKLSRHQLVHSGEKPFACSFEGCKKRFSLDFNLRTHIRIHTGVRPYACPLDGCRKSFSQSTNLKSHIETHGRVKKNRGQM